MQRQFLQEKSLNRSADNAEKYLNVDLSAKSRLIPYSTAAGMLGLNDLYIEERDACENYRMIFTVNPVCTNALYNAVTEPVYKEGSYSAITLVESAVSREQENVFPEGVMNQSSATINQQFAVRDTEFSHERIGDFKYHCGYDFFNNHLMRTNEFEHVSMENPDGTRHKNVNEFNTIFDFAVDFSGKTVQRVINESEGPIIGELDFEDIRMYQLDNIKSMSTAFYDNLREVDGWYGFYNTGYINIPNGKLKGKEISLNHILNNEIPCGFIDLYPDRTLYSFIPKVNRYKKRIERNWDCSIAYPYKSDTEFFNKVNINTANAIRVINCKVVYNNVGDALLEMHTLLRHSLVPGDDVRLFYRDFNEEEKVNGMNWDEYSAQSPEDIKIERFSVPVKVVSVGDVKGNYEKHYFCIKLHDISTFCDLQEVDGKPIPILKPKKDGEEPSKIFFFFKKIESGYDDKYYFRKFKQLVNYEYVQVDKASIPEDEIDSVVEVPKEPSIINDDSPNYIEYNDDFFAKTTKPLTYTQNKIAFGENIYGDRVAQVIFNDDICITNLKDNLGRPLSVVYFLVVKTNRGHKEWYEGTEETDNKPNATVDKVEYSHCFGEVTSGLDLPMDDESTEYNVRKLYNIFSAYTEFNEEYSHGLELALENAPTGNYSGTPTPIESGITVDMNEFYGDIVEYSKANFYENTLEKVYHRFNTAQRECLVNENYFGINYDELTGDLYDVKEL